MRATTVHNTQKPIVCIHVTAKQTQNHMGILPSGQTAILPPLFAFVMSLASEMGLRGKFHRQSCVYTRTVTVTTSCLSCQENAM